MVEGIKGKATDGKLTADEAIQIKNKVFDSIIISIRVSKGSRGGCGISYRFADRSYSICHEKDALEINLHGRADNVCPDK